MKNFEKNGEGCYYLKNGDYFKGSWENDELI